MRRFTGFLFAALMAPAVASAVAVPADTLQVNVTVEVVMPDSSRVAKTVTTALPASETGTTWIAPAVAVEPVIPQAADYAGSATDSVEVKMAPVAETLQADSASVDSIPTLLPVPTPYIKPPTPDPTRVHFAWGAELGSTIDLSAHDMSSIDFNAYFGLRYKWLSLAGIGAGADIMVSNSCRTYPVYAVVRTDFSRFVKLVFLDLRGGVALNYLPANQSQRGGYASVSVGFNLARSAKFRSYVLAGYTYVGRKDIQADERLFEYPSLSMASIRLGVAF